jgi:hypothetical protein
VVAATVTTGAAAAQTPGGAAADTPSIKIGTTIFADFTIQQEPKTKDADGNEITPSAFNVNRAYLNLTGTLSRRIAFRVTPDITRLTDATNSLNGSMTFRLKYAYAQFNLDDWAPKGSWVRFGMQQTPWIDFQESVYRYRFQGPVFEDRDGFLSSSDVGVSYRHVLPGDYGDVHAGIYNGETYSRPEANDQKAFQVRGTIRPVPSHAVLRGLRFTGFYDHDAYVRDAERRRVIASTTFEHRVVHAGVNYFAARDRTRAAAAAIDARGFSAFVTPRAPNGWEGLLRYDHLEPNTNASGTRRRTIAGVAYWFRLQGTVTTALLFNVDHTEHEGFLTSPPTQRRWGLNMLVNF